MTTTLPDTPTGNEESEADERKRLLADINEMDEGFQTGFEEPPAPVNTAPTEELFETPEFSPVQAEAPEVNIGGVSQPPMAVKTPYQAPEEQAGTDAERQQLLRDLGEDDPVDLTWTNAVQTLNAGIADILDLPGHVAAGLTNLIGRYLGAIPGYPQPAEMPSGGFRMILENIKSEGVPSTLPDDQLPHGPVGDAIRFIGQNIALLPVSVFGSFIKEAETIIKAGTTRAGTSTTEGTAEGILQRFKNFIARPVQGEASGNVGTLVQGLKQEAQLAGHGLKDAARLVGKTAVANPKSFTATELLASGGAGFLFGAAEESTDDASLQFLAGMVGGLTPSVSIALLNSYGVSGIRLLNDARLSFTKAKADPRASERLQKLLLDTDDVDNFKDENLLPDFVEKQTPAQATGQAGMLALERAIYTSDDVSASIRAEGNIQLAELNEVITSSMTKGSGVEDAEFLATINELRAQQGYYEKLWSQRQEVARARAKKRIKALGPKTNKERTNTIVREEIEKALGDAIATQKQLWSRVDKNRKISTLPLKKVWMEMMQDMTRLSDKGDLLFSTSKGADDLMRELGFMGFDVKGKGFVIDRETGKFVPGRMGDTESIKVLQDLRSRLLEELRRKLDREPSDNKKRIFKKLQNTIMGMFKTLEKDIITVNPDGTFTFPDQRLLNAISFSRQMNVTFNRGPVGKLLRKNADGTWNIEPEQTLVKMMGAGVSPEQAKANMKAMFAAVERETKAVDKARRLGIEDDPSHMRPTTEAFKAYLKHQFVEDFVDSAGRIKSEEAKAWMTSHREDFKLLPGFTDDIKRAIEADDALSLIDNEATSLRGLMDNKERAAATRFIQQTPEKIFDSVIDQYNPDLVAKEMRTLLHKTKKDASGEATKGLQQSVFDWILNRSLMKGEVNVDVNTQSFFSGWQMTQLMKKPQTKAIIETILTKEQQNRLKLVQNSANKLDLIRKSRPAVGGIISDTPGWILEFIGSVAGAQIGRVVAGKLGGGTVQTPHAFANRAKYFLKSLTKDHARIALVEAFTSQNPDRLKALLMLPKTADQYTFQATQMEAWAVELMTRYNINTEELE